MSRQNEVYMTTPELIEAHGYIAETHQVWTKDDYCLRVHRVISPNDRVSSNNDVLTDTDTSATDNNADDQSVPLNCNQDVRISCTGLKLPILLNHGLLSSSADFVLLGPRRALAYLLCDNGFDVWLTNCRGNTYSKHHKFYSRKDKEFWNFSFHDIGCYDLPATIDYILEKTGHSKLYFIGHSQGAASFYIMGSEKPEYIAKIKGMISLAPAAFVGNQKSLLLKYISYWRNILEWGFDACNMYQVFPRFNKWQTNILSTFLHKAPYVVTKSIYSTWFYFLAGYGSNQFEKTMAPLIFAHFPAGASSKQLTHYNQLIYSKSFQKYDHGAKKNLTLYGSTEPPKYNLERLTVPIAIFYSHNDRFLDYADVETLVSKLPNVVQIEAISYKMFNHVDFLWGRDAKELLYDKILSALKNF
ncbi:lipase 3-like isoform X2 [Pseudomyrmex gracilis]|uniref:lipase 3-like isoform X2 n=1 Tax=Pseudomyrmex gracilis TaxID=219809 RepID=UPI000994C459|nr:lipase 3-like isoform X2 [Pseudomyrmex gracilis]